MKQALTPHNRLPGHTHSMSRNIREFLVWALILLLAIGYLLPYFLFKDFFSHVIAYGSVSLLPLCVAAYFHGKSGTVITWGAVVLGTACAFWASYGVSWPSDVLINYLCGDLAGLIIGLATAQFFHMHRQIITARLAAQEQAFQVAQQQQINELKDLLLMNLSHELRTPLTEVYGFLELLRDYRQQLDEPQQEAFLVSATHGCTELLDLIGSVLEVNDVEHQEQPEPCESISVPQLVQELIDHWGIQAKQNYTIVLDMPEKLDVWAIPHYLRQILRNLLSNAMKYSPLQSQIVVSAGYLESTSEGPLASPEIWISVKDEGPGIPPSEIPLLFNKFVRLKRDLAGTVRGTGLGLYISKQLVQAMQGRIWVESTGKAGEGSRFCLTLPRTTAAKGKEIASYRHSEERRTLNITS
jgi:signal transduction histidine kinase